MESGRDILHTLLTSGEALDFAVGLSRCRLVDNNLGRLDLLVSKEILLEVEHVKAHRTKRTRKRCRTLRNLSLKAMRKRMSWQK